MDSSNCNCCCGCQYSTPPWWVTMGFVSPYNNQHFQQIVPAPPNSTGGLINPAVPPPTPGHTQTGGGGLGGIIGGILNPLGGLLGGLL